MGRLWCLLLALCLWVMEVQGQDLFVTHPSTLLFGRDYTVNLALAEVKSVDKTVRVALMNGKGDLYEGSSQLVTIKAGSRTLKVGFQIPDEVSGSYGTLTVFAENGDMLLSSRIQTMRPGSSSVVVQTDRGKYKPGDTVRLRVLNIDSQGMPSQRSMDVEIQDIHNKTLWKRTTDATDMDRGLMEGSYTLIKDAAVGEYKIIAHSNPEKRAIFFVEKYTLPKFEVTLSIDALSVVRNLDGGIPLVGRVEARYTYGEFVRGSMTLKVGNVDVVSNQSFEGSSLLSLVLPSSTFPVSESRQTLKVVAIVTEAITNNMLNTSQMLTVLPKPFMAQPMESLPYLFESDETYSFEVYLRDGTGGVLMDWEQNGMSNNLTYYRLYYEYSLDYGSTTTTMSMPVDSNPVTVSIDVNQQTYLTNNQLKVWFVYKDRTENMVTGEKKDVPVRKMATYSGSYITVNITSQVMLSIWKSPKLYIRERVKVETQTKYMEALKLKLFGRF